jgi:hypothetical protein
MCGGEDVQIQNLHREKMDDYQYIRLATNLRTDLSLLLLNINWAEFKTLSAQRCPDGKVESLLRGIQTVIVIIAQLRNGLDFTETKEWKRLAALGSGALWKETVRVLCDELANPTLRQPIDRATQAVLELLIEHPACLALSLRLKQNGVRCSILSKLLACLREEDLKEAMQTRLHRRLESFLKVVKAQEFVDKKRFGDALLSQPEAVTAFYLEAFLQGRRRDLANRLTAATSRGTRADRKTQEEISAYLDLVENLLASVKEKRAAILVSPT